jgi:hypothetical protein
MKTFTLIMTATFAVFATALTAQEQKADNVGIFARSRPVRMPRIVTVDHESLSFIGSVSKKAPEAVVDASGAMFVSYSPGSNLEIYENSKHELYIVRDDAPILKVDMSGVNKTQIEAMAKALRGNHGESEGTAYHLDDVGNFIGPKGVRVIQASSEWGPRLQQFVAIVSNGDPSKLVYNVKSDEIAVDFDPKDERTISSTAQLEAFVKEVSELLEKYPNVRIDMRAQADNSSVGINIQMFKHAPRNLADKSDNGKAADFLKE